MPTTTLVCAVVIRTIKTDHDGEITQVLVGESSDYGIPSVQTSTISESVDLREERFVRGMEGRYNILFPGQQFETHLVTALKMSGRSMNLLSQSPISGFWSLVGSAPDPSFSLETSATTTSSTSMTNTHRSAVKRSMNAGFSFLGVGVTVAVSGEESQEVTRQISSSLALTETTTFSASCGTEPSPSGVWTIGNGWRVRIVMPTALVLPSQLITLFALKMDLL